MNKLKYFHFYESLFTKIITKLIYENQYLKIPNSRKEHISTKKSLSQRTLEAVHIELS